MTPAQLENISRQQAAFRQQQEKQNKDRIAAHIVPRDEAADSSLLDLSAFYNQLLPGQRFPTNAIVNYLIPGIHRWQGINFDVRGLVQAKWNGWTITNQIPVGQKCSELDFLLGADWPSPMNTTNCEFVVHFTNGANVNIPVVFGRDVASSRLQNKFGGTNPLLTNPVVWGERIYPNAPSQPDYGFYIKRWQNPFPLEKISSIDFEPERNFSGGYLVAITLQPVKKENP
jgi:hypothetical protein